MGGTALLGILAVSLVLSIAVRYLDRRSLGYTWLIVFATAAFGAYFSSETLPVSSVFESVKNWGPQVDGFYVIPGIIGGAILALVAHLGTRGTYATAAA